jgi:hypothetical protein
MAVDLPQPIVTARYGVPESWTLRSYLDGGGYEGLRRALSMPREELVESVTAATLLGRGGAGFPAGQKWSMLRKAEPVYLVVNGDESEPATFKDHQLMVTDPHLIVEGALVAAYAVNAAQAFIYVRGEFALGLERMTQAVNEAYEHGAIGRDIFGSGWSVDLVIHPGASRASAGFRASSRRSSRPPSVCTGRPPSSTTWRRSRTCRGSPSTVARHSRPWARAARQARGSSLSRAGSTAPATTRSRWRRRHSATSSSILAWVAAFPTAVS